MSPAADRVARSPDVPGTQRSIGMLSRAGLLGPVASANLPVQLRLDTEAEELHSQQLFAPCDLLKFIGVLSVQQPPNNFGCGGARCHVSLAEF